MSVFFSNSFRSLMILSVIASSFIAVACSDDDDDDDTSQTSTSSGYEYVNLGLSVKWATVNIGASSPEDYGDYYAWGEITTKNSYTDDTSATLGIYLADIAGFTKYDAARAIWGGKWRLPTYDELEELEDECDWDWTTLNDINGYEVTGPSGKSIFLPAAGGVVNTTMTAGTIGAYWGSSTTEEDTDDKYAACITFTKSTIDLGYYKRSVGRSIRPVRD